jgi:hypothetical protein
MLDRAAHVRARVSMTQAALSIPVKLSRLAVIYRHGVYLIEQCGSNCRGRLKTTANPCHQKG